MRTFGLRWGEPSASVGGEPSASVGGGPSASTKDLSWVVSRGLLISSHIVYRPACEIKVAKQQGDFFGALGSVRGPVSQSNDTGSRSGFDPVITRLTANLIGKKPPR